MRITGRKKAEVDSSQDEIRRGRRGNRPGALNIVGIGPGDVRHLTQEARDVLSASQVVVGYKTYVKLLGELVDGKEVASFGMTQETERARYAIKRAREGSSVALISSGDSGIYGMAGLVLGLLDEGASRELKINIVPGIAGFSSAAGLLGAPIMHDFAVISLSDLLTDMKLIKQRLEFAARADFVIVLYNPKSKKRTEPLLQAWQILMRHKSPRTPVGIVRNAARHGEEVIVTTLKDMFIYKNIDMATTLIVGNSHTYLKGKYMITPRGYNFEREGHR